MNLVVTGVVAGVLGTLAMNALSHLFALSGMLLKVDVRTIGRMAAGWTRGRPRYRHPSEIEQVANEKILGSFTHHAIGLGVALAYLLVWGFLVGGPASPGRAVACGVATTVASWFVVFPSLGLGRLGRRSPAGLRAPVSSLANDLFYGMGLAAGIALV